MKHYVEESYRIRIWFEELDKNKEMWKKLWNKDLNTVKRNIFKKL